MLIVIYINKRQKKASFKIIITTKLHNNGLKIGNQKRHKKY